MILDRSIAYIQVIIYKYVKDITSKLLSYFIIDTKDDCLKYKDSKKKTKKRRKINKTDADVEEADANLKKSKKGS